MIPAVAKVEGHSFFIDPLRNGGTVVDLGMNLGGFSKWILHATPCEVLGAEPVPDLFATLQELPRTRAVQVALSDRVGLVDLAINPGSCAALSITSLGSQDAKRLSVCSTTLERFLRDNDVGDIQLLKVDIEGGELGVLLNSPPAVLRRARQITCEFHNFVDPSLTPAVEQVKERLAQLGFSRITFSRDDSDTLFYLPSAVGLSTARRLLVIAVYKWLRGGSRAIRRRLGSSRQ